MHLSFEVTVEDLVAVQELCYARTPPVRNAVSATRWSVAAVVVLFTLVLSTAGPPEAAFVAGAIVLAAWLLCSAALLRWWIRWCSHRLITNEGYRTSLGQQEIELREDGFVVRTAFVESKHPWRALARIEAAPGFTFLCLDEAAVYVIPHRRLTASDLSAFLSDLSLLYHGRDGAPP